MEINFDLVVILLVAAIGQGLITAAVLFAVKSNRHANIYLALLVLGFSLQLLDYFFFRSGIYEQHGEFYFLPIFYSLAFGPLFYLYVSTLTRGDRRPATIVHFIPVIIQFLFYLSISFRSLTYKTDFWLNIHQPFTREIELYTSLLSIGIYLFLSIRLLQNYQQGIENFFSDTVPLTLRWLRNLLLGLLVLYLAWLAEHLTGNFRYGIVQVMLPLYVYWIAWKAALQKDLVVGQITEQSQSDIKDKQQEISADIIVKIKQAMEADKIYLNPALTLTDLAHHVKLPAKLVSFVINSQFHRSFNNFVNEYRVKEFKRKLTTDEGKRMTILGMALDSGFNSQASFYRVFKDITGVSPTAYQKTLLPNSSQITSNSSFETSQNLP